MKIVQAADDRSVVLEPGMSLEFSRGVALNPNLQCGHVAVASEKNLACHCLGQTRGVGNVSAGDIDAAGEAIDGASLAGLWVRQADDASAQNGKWHHPHADAHGHQPRECLDEKPLILWRKGKKFMQASHWRSE